MRSNVFYTLFVVVYYPICLLLYYEWKFDYSDEILTALLVAYFCMQSKKTFNKEFLLFFTNHDGLCSVFHFYCYNIRRCNFL